MTKLTYYETKSYIKKLNLKLIKEAEMQPEQFINLILEKSKDYLEEENEKIALPNPVLFTLTRKGEINSFAIPELNDNKKYALYKYRSLTLVRKFINDNSIVAYAITRKSLTKINSSEISYNENISSINSQSLEYENYNSESPYVRKMTNKKEKNIRANKTLKEEMKTAPQIINALRIFYASIEEKKEIVIPYTRDYDKITFEGFEEIRINKISRGLMFNLLD